MQKAIKQRPTKKEFQERCQILNKELRDAIIGGRLVHGELLPSENELMQRSRLSRGSVRKILRELEKAELIQRKQGHGTIVIGRGSSRKIKIDEVLVLPPPLIESSPDGEIPDFNAVRAMVLFEAVNNKLREYNIKCRRVSSTASSGAEIMSYLSQYRPQGVIALSQFYPDIDELTWLMARDGIPIVTLAPTRPVLPNILKLAFDNYHMGQTAAEYLIQIGHENIIEMTCRESLGWAEERAEAFQQYCRAEPGIHVQVLQMPGDVSGHVDAEVWREMGRILMREVLSSYPKATAVFCINDLVAYGAICEARERKINIPHDLSIIGCGDDSLIFGFDITTVSLEAYKIGTVAVDSLVKMIRHDSQDIASARINVNPSIINHNVTVAPRRSKGIA